MFHRSRIALLAPFVLASCPIVYPAPEPEPVYRPAPVQQTTAAPKKTTKPVIEEYGGGSGGGGGGGGGGGWSG